MSIPDARLAESSPAMTSATLPSGYCCPPLRTYPHVPGKPRQYIVAQPACTYLVLDTLKDRFQDPWVLVLLHHLQFLPFWRRLQEPIHSFCITTAAPVVLLGKPVTCPQVSLTRPTSYPPTPASATVPCAKTFRSLDCLLHSQRLLSRSLQPPPTAKDGERLLKTGRPGLVDLGSASLRGSVRCPGQEAD